MLRANAAALAGADWSVPVVLAGNAAVRDEVAAVLRGGGLPVTEADNVLPDIGRLAPESARAAIREVFLEHVIGGDRLSTDPPAALLGAGGDAGRRPGGGHGARPRARARRGVRRRPRRGRGDHRRLLRARPRRGAGDAGPRGGGHPRPAPHGRGRPRRVVERRRAAGGRGGRGAARAGRGTAGARRGGGHGRAAPAPARRGRLRAGRGERPVGRAGRAVRRGVPARRARRPSTPWSPGWLPTAAEPAASLADTEVVVDRSYVLAATGLLAADHPAAAAELARRLLAGTVTSPAG